MCPQELSFDYTKSRKIGYEWIVNFYAGTVTGSTNSFTWFGNTSSMTWQEVVDHLDIYHNKTHDFEFYLGNGNETVIKLDQVLVPYLKCFEIKNFGTHLSMSSKMGLNIYLVDQNRNLDYRMTKQSMLGDAIFQNPRSSTKLASSNFYAVRVKQLERRQDTGSCTNDVYSDCSVKGVQSKLIELLDCIPPWVSEGYSIDDPIICLQPVVIDDKKKYKATVKYIEYLAFEMRFRDDVRLENEVCLQPCTQLTYEVKNVGTDKSPSFENNWISLQFSQKVMNYSLD